MQGIRIIEKSSRIFRQEHAVDRKFLIVGIGIFRNFFDNVLFIVGIDVFLNFSNNGLFIGKYCEPNVRLIGNRHVGVRHPGRGIVDGFSNRFIRFWRHKGLRIVDIFQIKWN
jgi:hypothetical protein